MSSQRGSIALHCTGGAAGRRLPCSRGQTAGQALGKRPAATRRQAARCSAGECVQGALLQRGGRGYFGLDLHLEGPRRARRSLRSSFGSSCQRRRRRRLQRRQRGVPHPLQGACCRCHASGIHGSCRMQKLSARDCGPPSAAAAGACKGCKVGIRASPSLCKAPTVHMWHL